MMVNYYGRFDENIYDLEHLSKNTILTFNI